MLVLIQGFLLYTHSFVRWSVQKKPFHGFDLKRFNMLCEFVNSKINNNIAIGCILKEEQSLRIVSFITRTELYPVSKET